MLRLNSVCVVEANGAEAKLNPLAIGACCVLASAVVGYGSYEVYRESRQQSARYSYQPARDPALAKAFGNEIPSPPYQPNCRNPRNRDDADLCAQWAAVEQITETNRLAGLAIVVSGLAVLFTIMGAAFIYLTLRETRLTSRRQLRAYVIVNPAGILEDPKKGGRAVFQVVNTGQTPAYEFHFSSNIVIIKYPIEISEDHLPPLEQINLSDISLGTNRNTHIYRSIGIFSNENMAGVSGSTHTILCYGKLTYRDIFDEIHVTQFCHHYSGEHLTPESALTCNFGNRST